MLYIHRLTDLNQKSADTETLTQIRELKQRFNFPFSASGVQVSLAEYYISETDLEEMKQSLAAIEPAIESIKKLMSEKNSLHESVNLQRAIQILSSVPIPLSNNLSYAQYIFEKQTDLATIFTELLNKVPYLKTKEEKIRVNDHFSLLFEMVLRNKELFFQCGDIVHEGQINNLGGLKEGMIKGFFFHVTLEEELRKLDFNHIKARIDPDKIAEVEQIAEQISYVYKGVDRAYQINLRMIGLALLLYSFVKWVSRDIKR